MEQAKGHHLLLYRSVSVTGACTSYLIEMMPHLYMNVTVCRLMYLEKCKEALTPSMIKSR
jgi:hypothetical protein